MRSKAEGINYWIATIANEAIAEIAISDPENAKFWSLHRHRIVTEIRSRATREYSLQELNDIMHWKKPKNID